MHLSGYEQLIGCEQRGVMTQCAERGVMTQCAQRGVMTQCVERAVMKQCAVLYGARNTRRGLRLLTVGTQPRIKIKRYMLQVGS